MRKVNYRMKSKKRQDAIQTRRFGPRLLEIAASLALALLAFSGPAHGHAVPFSYLDLRFVEDGIDATLVTHSEDISYELAWVTPEELLNQEVAQEWSRAIAELVRSRLLLKSGGEYLRFDFGDIEALPERKALQFRLKFHWQKFPGALGVHCLLFPYDPKHQTFVNVYEQGQLTHQEILSKTNPEFQYYTGSAQGTFAVISKFVPAGIEHILIGPDHVLFIIGLLLLGGSMLHLLKIVTAFTIAHSITLTLAALQIFSPPARVIEPAIALSIVYVGIDNLLVGKEGRDARAWIAFFFGFIHGFGFAYVLREFGLPARALGWSLFSFNFGVEIGQACIVVVVATLLAAVRNRNQQWAQRIILGGSAGVILAGAYWFVQRVFFNA
jgi:hydrogenase/urease accessory protein HupE